MNAKLTLSVDPRVVASAKRYAADAGISVSQLVEDYLTAIAASSPQVAGAPVLERLRGSLREGDLADYRQHLVEKYG